MRRINLFITAALLSTVLLSSCASDSGEEAYEPGAWTGEISVVFRDSEPNTLSSEVSAPQLETVPPESAAPNAKEVLTKIKFDSLPVPVNEEFLEHCRDNYCEELYEGLLALAPSVCEEDFYELTGCTPRVLYDRFMNAEDVIFHDDKRKEAVRLGFTGDICLSENWWPAIRLDTENGNVRKCLTNGLLGFMRRLDILLINHEYSTSDRGEPLNGKLYTFRAKPERTQVLSDIGADIVSLANNHVFDFGEDAFDDTLDYLCSAGIPYVGAGMNRSEAEQIRYIISGGMKFAFVAATRAEKNIFTPNAGEDSRGVFYTYDDTRACSVISEAKQNADYVIVYVHWGAENSTVLEKAQTVTARNYIDAGADAVIGAHTHCLQGVEFYNGKPVFYSLGNFWFNGMPGDTGIARLTITPYETTVSFVPCLQSSGATALAVGDEVQRILSYLEEISDGKVSIDKNGVITDAHSNAPALH